MSLPELRRPSRPSNASHFKVRITESGTTFNEEVEIDTEEKTEAFHIPQHNNVDLSDIKHIFDMSLTIYRFPLKGVCYVAPLNRNQPPPDKLADDMTEATHIINNGGLSTTKGESTFRIKQKVHDFQYWDRRIQSFCSGLEVYQVERVYNPVSVTMDSRGNYKRIRRQSNSNSCPPSTSTLSCFSPSWNCWIQGRSCSYFLICTTITQIVNGVNMSVKQCDLKHIYDTIMCCTATCV